MVKKEDAELLKRMRFFFCGYRIYVNTQKPHCPLGEEAQFCEEGLVMNCRHFPKLLNKV